MVLTSTGTTVNSPAGDALSLEAYYGHIEIIQFLLENGQDPNDAWGYSDYEPGVCALIGENPSLEILHLLLRHGWRQRKSTTHTAAAELGHMEALRLLVEHGADLEEFGAWRLNPGVIEVDKWGTALDRAAYKGHTEAVAYVLDRGASVWFKDKKGRDVLWAARKGGMERLSRWWNLLWSHSTLYSYCYYYSIRAILGSHSPPLFCHLQLHYTNHHCNHF